jgi:hypothetical protein
MRVAEKIIKPPEEETEMFGSISGPFGMAVHRQQPRSTVDSPCQRVHQPLGEVSLVHCIDAGLAIRSVVSSIVGQDARMAYLVQMICTASCQ